MAFEDKLNKDLLAADKTSKTKLVFSTDKWFDRMCEICRTEEVEGLLEGLDSEWIYKFDGLTSEQVSKFGFTIHENWMIEVPNV